MSTEFDYEKAVEQSCKMTNRKPAFWFEVRVVIPDDVVEHQKAESKKESYKTLDERLEDIAKNWAKNYISKIFKNQQIFYDPYKSHAERDTLGSYGKYSYTVSLVYCWG